MKKFEIYSFNNKNGAAVYHGLMTNDEAKLIEIKNNTHQVKYKPFTKTEKVKLQIIENYIDWYCHNEDERIIMKFNATVYIHEDHVNEIIQNFPDKD